MGTSYTDEQKAEALELYMEHGPAEASRLCDIPSGTIRSWAYRADLPRLRYQQTAEATEAATARRDLKREELRELLLDQSIDLLHRMNAEHKDYRGKDAVAVYWDRAQSGSTKDYATAAAILIDKYRLEMGEATARTYHEGTDDIDRRVAQLVAEMGTRSEATAS